MSMRANAAFAAMSFAVLPIAAEPARAAVTTDLDRSIAVSETPSELQLPLRWWWPYGGGSDVCATFLAHGVGGGARSVLVTTAGLGGAQLDVVGTRNDLADSCGGSTRKPLVWLPSVGSPGTWLRLRVPREAFPAAGSAVSGKLRFASASRAPYDVPVQLSTPHPGPFWTALLWFTGLVIPGAIGFWFFMQQERQKAKNAERLLFESFKASNVPKLRRRFEAWYPAIIANVEHDEHWRANLLNGLSDDGIVQALTAPDRNGLMQAIDSGTPAEITDRLGAIFPVWSSLMRPKRNGV
jgi:hypothetical protein